jgi:hypothetical protein
MDLRQVVFAILVVLAASLNFAFFSGDMSDASVHPVELLFAALVVNVLATTLKFNDRTHMGAAQLSTSLVADLQLVAAALVWFVEGEVTGEVLSLSGGALLAGVVSVVLVVASAATGNLHRP